MKKFISIMLLLGLMVGGLPANGQDKPEWQLLMQARLMFSSDGSLYWSQTGHTLYFQADRGDAKVDLYQVIYDPASDKLLLDVLVSAALKTIPSHNDQWLFGVNNFPSESGFQIISVKTWEVIAEWPYQEGYLAASWSPDDQYIALRFRSNEIPQRDSIQIRTAQGELYFEEVFDGIVYRASYDLTQNWSPDSHYLAFNERGLNTLSILDLAENKIIRKIYNVTGGFAWHPDSRLIAVANDYTKATIWDVASGDSIGTLQTLDGILEYVGWRPDGKLLVTGSGDDNHLGSTKFWRFPTLELVNIIQPHDRRQIIGWNKSGNRFSLLELGRSEIWDGDGTHLILEDLQGAQLIRSVSPDGELLAEVYRYEEAANLDYSIRLRAVETDTIIASLEGHSALIKRLEWSADGQYLYSVSEDGDLRVWGRKESG